MPIQVNDGSLFWAAGIQTAQIKRDSAIIQQQFGRLGKSGAALGKLFTPAGLGITGLLVAMEQIGESAFKFSAEYESAFAQVKTITQEGEAGISEMNKSIIELTKNVPIGAKEGADALYQIVSAGFDGAEGLNLLNVASRAAIGGITDTATAADGLTTVLNAFGLQAEDSNKVADILFTTVRLGKTTFGELSSSIAQVASIAANSGIAFEDIAAAIATLTKQGVPTAQAVTQIRSAILATTEVLGDAAFEGRGLAEAFQVVRDASKGSNAALRESLGRVEALNAVLGLTGKNALTAAEDLDAIKDSTGAATDAFETMVETADNQLKLLGNNIKSEILEPIGDFLVGAVNDLAGKINEAFGSSSQQDLEKMSKNVNKLVVELSDANTNEARRVEILKELNGQAPEVVAGIDAEKVKLEELNKQLGIYNESQITRKALAPIDDEIKELKKQYSELDADLEGQAERTRGIIARIFTQIAKDPEKVIEAQKVMASQMELTAKAYKISAIAYGEANALTTGTFEKQTELRFKQVELNEKINKLEAERLTLVTQLSDKYTDLANAYNESLDEDQLNALSKRLQKAIADPSITEKLRDEFKKTLELVKSDIEELNDVDLDLTDIKVGVRPVVRGDLTKELKELRASLETATSEEAIEIFAKISIKEDELAKFGKEVVQEAGDVIEIKPEAIKNQEKYNSELADMTSSLARARVLATKLQKELDKATKEENAEKLADNLFRSAAAMDELSGLANLFDESLGSAISQLADIAEGAANIGQGIATDDPFAIIAGSAQILTTIFDNTAAKEFEIQQQAENLSQTLEQQNRRLERQIDLLKTLAGVERVEGEKAVLEEIERQVDALNRQAQAQDLVLKKEKKGGFLGIGGSKTQITQYIASIEDLIEKYEGFGDKAKLTNELLAEGFTIKNESQIKELIDQYDQLIAKRQELFEELTQTTPDAIATTIAEGFVNGKSSAKDFAGEFESLMKQAMIESFKTQFLIKASQGFFNEFSELAKGGLTTKEIENLRDSFGSIIGQATEQFEALNDIFKGVFGKDLFADATGAAEGLAGSIGRQITEDTATELVGLWTRTSFDTSALLDEVRSARVTFVNIETNTLRTAVACEELNGKINAASSERDSGNIL